MLRFGEVVMISISVKNPARMTTDEKENPGEKVIEVWPLFQTRPLDVLLKIGDLEFFSCLAKMESDKKGCGHGEYRQHSLK